MGFISANTLAHQADSHLSNDQWSMDKGTQASLMVCLITLSWVYEPNSRCDFEAVLSYNLDVKNNAWVKGKISTGK